ncbi:MAG: M24 family metallopeptidase [Acidimicrobiales bacterium]
MSSDAHVSASAAPPAAGTEVPDSSRLAAAGAVAGARPLPPMGTALRLGSLRQLMDEAGCEALIISNPTNVRYLSSFSGSSAMLLLLSDAAVLVTDGRYATQAPQELADAGVDVSVLVRRGPSQGEALRELLAGVSKVGLEADHVSWGAARRWRESWARGLELVPTTGLVEGMREKKSPEEVARVAAAAAIADAAFAEVVPLVHEQPTEAAIALALDAEMRRLGSEGTAFETIVAAGPNAAKPHHSPGERTVKPGEMVVMDFGARVEGYCSDMTRTVVAGGEGSSCAPELRRMYTVVLESQSAGLAAVQAGVKAADVDKACRDVVEAAGWGEYFVHSTGHGVGLDVHEAPSLGDGSEDILACGHVVTVEPGVYMPGLGGVRIEDMVVVDRDGYRALTASPKASAW